MVSRGKNTPALRNSMLLEINNFKYAFIQEHIFHAFWLPGWFDKIPAG